jgi:hypothetical protein
MDESGKPSEKYFFEAMPESDRSSRQRVDKRSPAQSHGQSDQLGMTGGELRLYVWAGLSERHRNEVCKQIRKRCEAVVSSLRVERSERQSEIDKLVSEVVAHLLRATSIRWDEK